MFSARRLIESLWVSISYNNNRMIQLTDVLCLLLMFKRSCNERLILLSVLQLSDGHCFFSVMVVNSGSTVYSSDSQPRGAAKRCQECRQIWNNCFIDVLLYKLPPNYHLKLNRVAAKFFKDLKAAANQKSLKSTGI